MRGTYGISLTAELRRYDDWAVDFIAILSLVFTVIAALSAVIAAFYAKGSLTKADLERVERNIAERVEVIRTDLAEQRRREAQLAAFERASMALEARGPAGEPLAFRFTLNDAGMELVRVDLVNADSMHSGSFPCTPTQPSCFLAKVDHDALRNWFGTGNETSNGKRVQIRAHLRWDGQEAGRIMWADLNLIRQEGQNVWTLAGKC